jgi:hypothetical protein
MVGCQVARKGINELGCRLSPRSASCIGIGVVRTGLDLFLIAYPALTCWAFLCRASGALMIYTQTFLRCADSVRSVLNPCDPWSALVFCKRQKAPGGRFHASASCTLDPCPRNRTARLSVQPGFLIKIGKALCIRRD